MKATSGSFACASLAALAILLTWTNGDPAGGAMHVRVQRGQFAERVGSAQFSESWLRVCAAHTNVRAWLRQMAVADAGADATRAIGRDADGFAYFVHERRPAETAYDVYLALGRTPFSAHRMIWMLQLERDGIYRPACSA